MWTPLRGKACLGEKSPWLKIPFLLIQSSKKLVLSLVLCCILIWNSTLHCVSGFSFFRCRLCNNLSSRIKKTWISVLWFTRKYPLCWYIQGVLEHTSPCDWLWRGNETLKYGSKIGKKFLFCRYCQPLAPIIHGLAQLGLVQHYVHGCGFKTDHNYVQLWQKRYTAPIT